MTTRYVVDANVVVKWFLPEIHHERARILETGASELYAPDFLRTELAQVFVKKVGSGQLDERDTRRALQVFPRRVRLVPSSFERISAAVAVALEHHRSVYDALYVALAVELRCALVTADRRLYEALAPQLAENLLWIEDVTAARDQ